MTPKDWRERPVRDAVASIKTGVSVNSEGRPSGPGEVGVLKTSAVTYGVFRPSENKVVARDELHRARETPNAGCVLLSRMNTPALVGASAYVDRDWPDLVLPDRLWQLRPNGAIVDGRWLFHALAAPSSRVRLTELASGTSGSMKNLSQEKFFSLRLACPPLGEQRKIAAILSSVDDAIEATQAVIEQLRVVKKAMMAELLTRGLPGRHTRFKMTEIGEVPEQWEIQKLGAVAEFQPGFPFKSADFVSAGDKLLRGSNVGVGVFDWSPEKTMRFPTERRGEVVDFVLGAGDIIVAMDRPFINDGFKIARLQENDLPALLLQRVGRFRKLRVAAPFLWTVLHSDLVQGRLKTLQKGTDLPHISKSEIESCKIPVPGRDEQTAIGRLVDHTDARIGVEHQTAGALRCLKSALMSVLLTGEVRVKPDDEAA